MRRTLIVIAVVAAAAVAASLPAGAATRSVSVQDNFFSPKRKTVKKGDTVRFEWSRADNPHNVKFTRVPAGARRPRSCKLRTAGECRRTFRRRGTYRYVCTLHLESDDMRGSIRVE